MTANEAARRVLREAADSPNFFDLSDGERLVRMLEMAFQLGQHVGKPGKGVLRRRVVARRRR